MPDDLAKYINEALNQKTLTSPIGKLMDSLCQAAKEIADLESEQNDWADWVDYLLEQQQVEAEKDFKAKDFEMMLITLRDSLNTHIDKGKW